MRQDFETRLRLQLRAAAERDASGGVVAHALRDARGRLGSPALAGGLAVVAVAVAVVIGALALRGEQAPPVGPRVVARLALTPNPEQVLSAFGSAWIADPNAGEIVRVDPESRRVIARIRVGGQQRVGVNAVAGELWITIEQRRAVLRVDPATNALLPRLTLRTPGGRRFAAGDVLAHGRLAWALGFEQALRVDPATGAGLQLIEPRAGVTWFELGDDTLWALGRDGILRGLDAQGRTVRELRPQLPGTELVIDVGSALLANSGPTLARIDTSNGRVEWQRTLGRQINNGALGNGVFWVQYSPAHGSDRLAALALDDGATVAETALPVLGATGMAMIDRELWIDTPGGRTLVVRP